VNRVPASALALTGLAYLPCVLCMMSIGIIVPFIEPLGRYLQTSPAQLGLAIALFSMPTAVLATVGGSLIDRHGVKRSMVLAAALAALGSLAASQAHALLWLDCAMLISGLGFGVICVAAPCLIIVALRDASRIRAMAFLSTFAPTGYAAGLLLAVPFTGSGHWRVALLLHAAIMALMCLGLLLLLPQVRGTPGERGSLRSTVTEMFGILRQPRALRLGIAVALPNAVSYGTSLAAPAYLAREHHLSIAASSATVALAKITAMIIGGLSMGYVLSRTASTTLMFAIMVAIGALAQTILFLPASAMTLATAALIVWLFAFGGMAGGAMTLLPSVVRDPGRSGAASGLVNQFISLASFAAPSTWLALHDAIQFVLLALVCLLISLMALPARAAPAAPAD
jgi:predicted MFS family arabinose efflux permease